MEQRPDVEPGRNIGQRPAAHQGDEALGQRALLVFRKSLEKHVGDDQAEHPVAEEFEPFEAAPSRLRAGMSQRLDEQFRTAEVVIENTRRRGEAVKRERVGDFVETDAYGNSRRFARFMETLPNGRRYQTLDIDFQGAHDNTDVYVVPEGHYFAMGDNRDNSLDSRVTADHGGVGFIPVENLVGRAEIIFFSTNGDAQFWELWKWPTATRFGRLFNIVE